MSERIFVINPGTTSTKAAFFNGEAETWKTVVHHDAGELQALGSVADQLDYRYQLIREAIPSGLVENCAAVVGRGGLLRPCEGGTYLVDRAMLEDVREARWGEHASNLGSMLAHRFAGEWRVPAYIVDPVSTDEFEPVSRISGVVGIERKCRAHALNIKATARRAAVELDMEFHRSRFVVAHLGGGFSIAVLKYGKIVDVNDGLLGMGPFSPQRAGALPLQGVMDFVRDKGYERTREIFSSESGFVGYFGTADLREIERRIAWGDDEAKLVREAMIYQAAKEIGGAAAALKGNLDGIVLTGGLIHSRALLESLKEYISFLGKVFVYPGEEEMSALALGALRVIRGKEPAKRYGKS